MARISVAREVQKPQDYASDGTDAVGFVQFWGNSPALDLLDDPQAAAFGPAAIATCASQMYKPKEAERPPEPDGGEGEQDGADGEAEAADRAAGVCRDEDPDPAPLPEGEEPVNILITGGCDLRHVLKTVARRRKHNGKLRFFLHETHHEVLARHLLFLQLINNKAMPLRERMEMFLSLYGNTLVRERDSTYAATVAAELVELVADDSDHPLTRVLDLTHLKFKDRDILQDVFKGWFKEVPFDAEALREQRCRGYYRDRYDYRKNLMDWDYQSFIKEAAGIINWFHYKEFCFTGVAFEARLASYNSPNRTLASYTEAVDKKKGTTVQVRGFWGDIVNSPYHAFGTTTNPEDRSRLFKITGSQYRHTETDISEFNVTAYLSEMETGQRMHLPPEKPEEHVYPYASPLDELRAEDKVVEVQEEPSPVAADAAAGGARSSGRRRAAKKAEWPPLVPAFEGVEVVLLAGDIREVLRKSRYRRLFHRVFVGAMAVMPHLEDMELTHGRDDTFSPADGTARRIRRPPRLEKPEAFGKKREQCALAGAVADGGLVVFETMKYQAHFDASARLAFRHRIAQVGHLAGWRLLDERRAVPRLEHDMQERRARETEKDSTDFLRFVVVPRPEAPSGE